MCQELYHEKGLAHGHWQPRGSAGRTRLLQVRGAGVSPLVVQEKEDSTENVSEMIN